MIYLWPQNRGLYFGDHLVFRPRSLSSKHFFLGLWTGKSCCGHRVSLEASGSVIPIFLSSFSLMCDKVYGFDKESLFLLRMWSFFRDFSLEIHQLDHVTFANDYLAFFKIVNEQSVMRIPKYGCHNLTSCSLTVHWTLESSDTSKLHIDAKSFSISPKQLQTLLRIIDRVFWLTVDKRGTRFEDPLMVCENDFVGFFMLASILGDSSICLYGAEFDIFFSPKNNDTWAK